MTPEEALALIDHAVGDWSVSDDAMRWNPNRAQAEPGLEDRLAGIYVSDDSWLGRVIAERLRTAMWTPRVFVSTTGAEPVGGEDWVELGRGGRVGPARVVSTSTSRRGATPTRVVVDEISGWTFPGAFDHADPVLPGHLWDAAREIDSFERRLTTTDPDKPGRVIALRHGVAAQHSPYGPKPRSRDGQMQGDDARRARLSPRGRPRGARTRAHLGDEACP